MARVLLVDNYDSFTYNLAHLFEELGAEVVVLRNDQVDADEAERLEPTHLVVSPGPGRPEGAGASIEIVKRLAGKVPILGVCLGHQAIGAAFGGDVVRAGVPMHGKTSTIEHDGKGVFRGIAGPFVASRYHSLVVAENTLPAELMVTARTREDSTVMGLRHRRLPIFGVQFHPESILTGEGKTILRNFIEDGRG